jgi:hypothetical protein
MKTKKRHRRHRWWRYSKHSLTRKKRRKGTRKKKQRGGGWGSLTGSFAKKIGTLKSKFSSLKNKMTGFASGDSDAPGVPELPKQFGNSLEVGKKFTGNLPIPASLNKSANIETSSMGIPNTIPAKLETSNLSNELKLQNEKMDELTKKMDILFEK